MKSVPNNATPLKKRAKLVTIDDLSATIISQLFWPQLPAEEFTLLPEVRVRGSEFGFGCCSTGVPSLPRCPMVLQVQSMLQTYGFKYHSLKAPRELQWKPNLGTVSLEVMIGTDCLEFNVRAHRHLRWLRRAAVWRLHTHTSSAALPPAGEPAVRDSAAALPHLGGLACKQAGGRSGYLRGDLAESSHLLDQSRCAPRGRDSL